eukprot:TRINITY_DN6283_c0_g1_i1.p1 TRINITY_DN6283_c0_g1~~TRINITY_DN6283_c0_g1_i1.p1  ORF type:complete len:398 (+),score=69.70 TRINITY_DN6283_c0_g1_i1:18-1211(+)
MEKAIPTPVPTLTPAPPSTALLTADTIESLPTTITTTPVPNTTSDPNTKTTAPARNTKKTKINKSNASKANTTKDPPATPGEGEGGAGQPAEEDTPKLRTAVPDKLNLSLVNKNLLICDSPRMTLIGYSRSTERTFFHVPEFRMMLDAGSCLRDWQPEWVFVSHSHDDHLKGLPYICTKEGGVTVYCPEDMTELIEKYVYHQFCTNSGKVLDLKKMKWKLVGLKGGDTFDFGKHNLHVKVFQCFHSIPCLGFGFSEKRKRLRPALQGSPPAHLAALRKAGQALQEDWYKPLFVYLGDTHTDVFEKNPDLFTYPTIIVECTFLEDDPALISRARDNGHVHWNLLKPIILTHPDITFVLIHFSLRYQEKEIILFFEKESQKEKIKNIVIFAGEGSLERT